MVPRRPLCCVFFTLFPSARNKSDGKDITGMGDQSRDDGTSILFFAGHSFFWANSLSVAVQLLTLADASNSIIFFQPDIPWAKTPTQKD
jgi:hypothetical protein